MGVVKEVVEENKDQVKEITDEVLKTSSKVIDKGVSGVTRAAGNAVGAAVGVIPGADVLYEGFRTGSTLLSTGLSMANEAMTTGEKANELIQDTSQSVLGKTDVALNGDPSDPNN